MKLYFFVLISAVLPGFALAIEIPACPTPGDANMTTSLSDLPRPIADSLKTHVPNLAPVDAPFHGGDALRGDQTLLDRRFIRAFHQKQRWVVAYEAAGMGSHDVVVAYDASKNGRLSRIVSKIQTSPGEACHAMTMALNPDWPINPYW